MAPDAPAHVQDRAGPVFSERLRRRRELWWGRPFRWRDAHSYRDALHRTRERFALRSRSDSDAAWHCCPYWPRTLVNKWNSREFAQGLGCRVPVLLWHGRRITKIPYASLPAQFVIRPVWGTTATGVHVVADGRELLRDEPASTAHLKQRLWREHGPVAATPLLIETFVPAEDGERRMPIEYKCHAFAGTIAAVQVLERTGQLTGFHRYYTPGWEPFPDVMDTNYPPAPRRAPPRCLDEMLDAAARLSRAIGTYMRIDFFGSAGGAVFNEFSSTPQVRTTSYTRYCDAMFGDLWQLRSPDAV